MGTLETALAIAAINVISEIIRTRMNKPEGWKPSAQELADFIVEIDAATPEAEKKAARERLNIPAEIDTPQAPV